MVEMVSKHKIITERVRGYKTHTALVQKNTTVYPDSNIAIVITAYTVMIQYPAHIKLHVGFSDGLRRQIDLFRPASYTAKESLIRDFLETCIPPPHARLL
ncbi:hypothetical protein K466DRAFT_602384 [Polyporus arcularius HHB13444]|uniref:Uncharacterized protein n=1 Tax=Polyporus arcularius HHB13444 TaxID=1314778 RepID=A0A5C3P574_9APHY|nr:hypothetical protein K466DRAFT_602384 [Polyporus arcularius HHB13444]